MVWKNFENFGQGDCKCCNGCCFFYIFGIFSLGVAVAVLDRKLYVAGGFDGRQAKEVREV